MAERTLFINGTIYTTSGPWQDAWLVVQGQSIADLGTGIPPDVSAGDIIDLQGRALVPGLIDMHVHGALGHDAMEADAEALRVMARFFARHGVTSFLASTISASPQAIGAALNAINALVGHDTDGARLFGAHLEGPFIEAARRGAHDSSQIRLASAAECDGYLADHCIKMVTLAPEYPQNLEMINRAASQGIVVALGHSQATFEQVRQAVAKGANQVTHLFNAMSSLHHRQPGLIGAALTIPALTCELIADLVHLAASILQLTYAAKGAEGIILVTDAMSGTGMADGEYALWGDQITVRGGIARNSLGALAGSTLTLERGLYNMMQACNLSLAQALPMVTSNPARQLGMHSTGRIEVGCAADLAVLAKGQALLTMVDGKIVHNVL